MSTKTSPINWEKCLAHCNQKKELAEELLGMLTKDLPILKNDIQQSHKKQQLEELSNHIHKLHGACAYCGIETLKEKSRLLEDDLEVDQVTNLDYQITELTQEIDRVLLALKTKDYC